MFSKHKEMSKGTKTNLVIVESRGKVVSITKYLNSAPELKQYGKFEVMACFGHILDLKKKTLAIDVNDNFKAIYEPLVDKKDVIDNLKKHADKADKVWLASDSDVEGHAISYSLRELLKPKNYSRMVFNEITQKALVNAIKNAGDIDMDQVYAQQTRRILDRLVGFKLSPLLWKHYKTSSSLTLSAGRVQSCLLNLIIKRENEITEFKSKPYWHFDGDFTLEDKTILSETSLYKDKTIYKILNINDANSLLKKIKNDFKIIDVNNHITKKSPPMPYITTTLQQDAPFTAKQTMALAQKLYEGGYITYMRTDSYNMSADFKQLASTYILDTFGKDYLNQGELKQKSAIKGAQEAHECIRITDPTKVEVPLGKDEQKLYQIIWRRTIAYLMTQCIYDELDIKIVDSSFVKDMFFLSTFKKVKFNGFQIVYDIKNDKYTFEKYIKDLMKQKIKCDQIIGINTWTSPPARYNDSGLSKLMQDNGIARPSTVVTTISKLEERKYIIKSNVQGTEYPNINLIYKNGNITQKKDNKMVGAEQSKYVVSDIGFAVDKYISENFKYIVDPKFTSSMEADLDKIADAKKTKLTVLTEFWKTFSKDLDTQVVEKGYKKEELKTAEKEITVDGILYKLRIGKYGPLAEYEQNKIKKYLGLKAYLQLSKKDYLDIEADDIKFLLELPKKIGTVDGKPVILLIGPFGPYLQYNNSNVKIPRFALKEFGETKTFTTEQLKGFIQYAKEHPAKAKTADKPVSTKAKTTKKVKSV